MASLALAAALAGASGAQELLPPTAAEAAPAAFAPAPPAAPRSIDRLLAAWAQPGATLAARVRGVRAAADDLGIASVDPLAQAILWDAAADASPRARAEAAVTLAPGLPLAQAALAASQWRDGDRLEAVRSARAALGAFGARLDAWLWLSATASVLGFVALTLGCVAFLVFRGAADARFAWHDLGDAIEPAMPTVARVALLAAIALAPAALGEGLAGLALAGVALGFATPSRAQRIAVGVAALLFVLAVHPLAERAGTRIAAVGADVAALAAASAESGFVDAGDALRIAVASSGTAREPDPLAVVARAGFTRRAGDLAAADAQYASLVASEGADADVLSNAASVKLALGDAAAAVELYRRAVAIEPTAARWFHLAQAHGAAIDVEQHDRALAAAQSIDPDLVSRLTAQRAAANGSWAPAVPIAQERLRERLLARDGSGAASALRARVAPGWLGRSPWIAVVAFALAGALGVLLASRFERSAGCRDCGAHLCPRCGTAARGDGRCESCQRRRFEGRAAWESGALARSPALRVRAALATIAPGLAGASGRLAPFGLVVALAVAAAAACWLGRDSVLPDPGSVGGAGALAFGVAALACVVVAIAAAAAARLVAQGDRS